MTLPRYPRLALPFTFLTGPDRVRLVAGEDFRFTLAGPGIGSWLPDWLALLDGRRSLEESLARLPAQHHDHARRLLERLVGERVVIDGPVEAAHPAVAYALALEGTGVLRDALQPHASYSPSGTTVAVLCQDRLDLDEGLKFNLLSLSSGSPWMWVSCGAMARGYVSPVFLPDAGPCLACLFTRFQSLSPLPAVYDELVAHARSGGLISPSPFPAAGVSILVGLVLGKVGDWLARREPPAALYRLHVLEASSLEVSSHRVFLDSECSACRGRR